MSFLLGSLRNIFADKAELNQCVQRKITERGVRRLRVGVQLLCQRGGTGKFWLVSDADCVHKLFGLYGCNSPNPQLKSWFICEVCDPLIEPVLFYLCSQNIPLYLEAWQFRMRAQKLSYYLN